MAHVAGEVIRRLEEQLLDQRFRHSPEAVADLLADEFQEFGASGRSYDKSGILAALAGEQAFSASLSDFTVHGLASGCVLATYRVRVSRPGHESSHSLRSSIWVFRAGRWQMLFHQGTPMPDAQAKK